MVVTSLEFLKVVNCNKRENKYDFFVITMKKFASSMTPEGWMGSELETYGSDNSGLSVFFSTDFMKHRLYQLSPVEVI
jgi:hypothetical protein